MNVTVGKAKQYLIVTLKIVVVATAAWFIYARFTADDSININTYFHELDTNGSTLYLFLIPIILLLAANWYCEISKWQTAVSAIKTIKFQTAAKQSLAALTVSLATPNRIGDYGAKALFFGAKTRKTILLLNLFSNLFQLATTICFGIIGILLLIFHFKLNIAFQKIGLAIGLSSVIVSLIFIFRKQQIFIKGFTVEKVFKYFKKLPTEIKLNLAILSVLKYISFSSLFYILLIAFGVQIEVVEAFCLIFSMYLFASIIPTIFIWDVVVRGGVAIWLFGMIGVAELPILCTVFTMWFLNFVIPAIVGSFYVLKFKMAKI